MNRTVFPNGKTIGWITDVPHKHGRETAIIPYQTGDRLWAKEAHWALGHWQKTDKLTKRGKPKRRFVRSLNEPVLFKAPDRVLSPVLNGTFGWYKRSSLFHPKADSRTTLLITDVRVQRLQDISEADAVAEGVRMLLEDSPADAWFSGIHKHSCFTGTMEGWHYNDAKTAFRDLINSINGPDTWEQNPWVVAYSFKVDHRNFGVKSAHMKGAIT
ncbi:MAG: hypothetical protein COB08_000685 [Rhodobacteraceae bacterium]|nr:hypothetical protein [Paracoccaceae bacterium]